ncbi:hypothetical protein [Streptomyces sp. DHE17-7]|uniref:hypothetical protein n=1 Tax=Streptomyces sp. DHE17-7 TaxID=2759949 RepID=UPI0022EAABEF|nr:hypothetical protein [Streptomyces sp. DHE17-7]
MGNPISESGLLSADAVRAFGLIAAGELVPAELAGEVENLVEWGYVVLDSARGDRPVALNPEQVSRRRMDAELREAAARVDRMSRLPALAEQLSGHYERAQWRSSDRVEYIDDPAVVNARLDQAVGAAEREILAAQPGGPRTRKNVSGAVDRDTAALDRGVRLRTLYQATVRDHALTADHARAMATRSTSVRAEYRTLVGPFERCIVVDDRVAFISNYLVEQAPAHAAWQITCRATVAYIVAEFESKWRRADPWFGELRPRSGADEPAGGGVRTTRRQREILRDQAAGIEQRITGQRLGIGLRTVSDEIAALKVLFGASSLPELTYKWALSPDRHVDDSAPADGPAGAEYEKTA